MKNDEKYPGRSGNICLGCKCQIDMNGRCECDWNHNIRKKWDPNDDTQILEPSQGLEEFADGLFDDDEKD